MRIGINATSLSARPSGARQRFEGVYGALFRANPENEYLIYEPRDCKVAAWFPDCPNIRGIPTTMSSAGRWSRLLGGLTHLRRRLAADRLDLFEALHLPVTRSPSCPTITTIHDIRGGSDQAPPLQRQFYRRMLRHALRSSHVITVSNSMKRSLLAVEPAAHITTIYNGIDPARFAAGPGEAFLMTGDFLLAVGHFELRKNYDMLVRAMALLAVDVDVPRLVIVGKDGGSLDTTRALIASLGLAGKVDLLLDVDDARLAALYRAARLLVFPSKYEGFGIPVLEAMASQLPMALSDLPVFRELTEDRADYFDPADPAAMARSIKALLTSPQRQVEQLAYGHARIAQFEFHALAAQLDALHRETVSVAVPRVVEHDRC